MWIPSEFPYPVSSYAEAVAAPGADPFDAPLMCVAINAHWIPYVAGAMMQLVNPATWIAGDQAALFAILEAATRLISAVGMASECTAVQLRYTAQCGLQTSTDGTTWVDVPGWSEYFAACVRQIAAAAPGAGQVIMADGTGSPPVPVWTDDGSDWLYTD